MSALSLLSLWARKTCLIGNFLGTLRIIRITDLTMPNRIRKSPTKGDQTRERILNAALDIIVEQGFTSLSHRTIATRAEVQLSLTSYYFGNLDNLLLEAYRYFAEREILYIQNQTKDLDLYLASAESPGPEEITRYLVNYALFGMRSRLRELAIDCKFLFEPDLPAAIVVIK